MSIADLVRGPDRVDSISLDGWMVSGGKATGVQPGFRMTDPTGTLYQIEFDPPSNPEMATGAEIIGTAFYHAFGYHTVDVYLAELDRESPHRSRTRRRVFDPLVGERRRLTRRDVDNVLRRGGTTAERQVSRARQPLRRRQAARQLPLLRHAARRPERHRAARAPPRAARRARLRRLAESRRFARRQQPGHARQQQDRRYVKHYMFDFGSILGSGTVYGQRHRPGNEYILEWKPGWLTLATLGIYTRPWMHIDYPEVPPAIGRFEADAFEPETWKPEYPNPAFANMRPDDAFWAARIVARFGDDAIRAIVEKARYTDPRATEYMTATLIKRRDKVLETLADGGQSAGGFRAERHRRADVRERRRAGGRRDRASELSPPVGSFRQCDQSSGRRRRRNGRERNAGAGAEWAPVTGLGPGVRAGSRSGRSRPVSLVGDTGDGAFPTAAARLEARRPRQGSTLTVYPSLSHGTWTINQDQINSDLLAFIQASRSHRGLSRILSLEHDCARRRSRAQDDDGRISQPSTG